MTVRVIDDTDTPLIRDLTHPLEGVTNSAPNQRTPCRRP